MKIKVMNAGDKVLFVNNEFIAVERVSGEVDILPLIKEDSGVRIDTKNTLTIAYGENIVETKTENGVTIANF